MLDHEDIPDDEIDFPLHRTPTSSKLKPYKALISRMRAQRWPYQRIVQWLKDEKEVSISWESLRQFCLYRNIRKGAEPAEEAPSAGPRIDRQSAQPRLVQEPQQKPRAGSPRRRFVLDRDAPPTPIRRN